MPISIQRLTQIYITDFNSPESKGWLAVPDSKEGSIIANALGSSGGNPGNGWKIHISIDPDKIALAAQLIANELNQAEAPRVSIKFAGKQLAPTGQPSKQIALIFYNNELRDRKKIAAFLSKIALILDANGIGIDERPINSDKEAVKTKYDAVILDNKGKPTRFNYRNEQCIVMEDELYEELGGTGNTLTQGEQIWVKQSYYLNLPAQQKHNPGNQAANPFAEIRVQSFDSSLTDEQIAGIEKLIDKLEKEIQSCWPYANKDRKAEKVKGLKKLLDYAERMDITDALDKVEKKFPDLRKGSISTRTADLLDDIRNSKHHSLS